MLQAQSLIISYCTASVHGGDLDPPATSVSPDGSLREANLGRVHWPEPWRPCARHLRPPPAVTGRGAPARAPSSPVLQSWPLQPARSFARRREPAQAADDGRDPFRGRRSVGLVPSRGGGRGERADADLSAPRRLHRRRPPRRRLTIGGRRHSTCWLRCLSRSALRCVSRPSSVPCVSCTVCSGTVAA